MTNTANSTRTTVDSLILTRWLATVNTTDDVLENTCVVVDKGVIIDLLPNAEAQTKYLARSTTQLDRHLVIPGLVNAHGHSPMVLLRGFADDLPLQTWLEQHIWPAEGQFVSYDFAYQGSQVAIAEMIKSGTTCFTDMYFFPEATYQAVTEVGMRAHLAPPVLDFPTNWQPEPSAYLSAIQALHQATVHDPLVTVAIGPHAPYTVCDDTFGQVLALQQTLDCGLHIHVHETAGEVSAALEQTGKRPIARLNDLGVLGAKTQAVHVTQVDEQDLAILAESGTSVVHCPRSNLKLASGFCPVQRLLNAGVNVALGTDGGASNNSLDMLSEMQYAALLAKAVSGDASAVSAATALRMATLNGAKALGLDEQIGSIDIGKQADLTAIQLDQLTQQPLYSPLSALVYTNTATQVTDVWIAGRQQLANGELTRLQLPSLTTIQAQWQQAIAGFQ